MRVFATQYFKNSYNYYNYKNFKNSYCNNLNFNPRTRRAQTCIRGINCQCFQKATLTLSNNNIIQTLDFITNDLSKNCALNECNSYIRNKMINKNILEFIYIDNSFFNKKKGILPIEKNCMQITKESIHNILKMIF